MKNLFFPIVLLMLLVSCSKEKKLELKNVTIVGIHLLSYPVFNGINEWDNFSNYPDIYFICSKDPSYVIFTSSVINEAYQGQAIWSADITCDPIESYTFLFYDEDGNVDDYIDAINVYIPNLEDDDFPEEKIFNSGGIYVKLFFTYRFE